MGTTDQDAARFGEWWPPTERKIYSLGRRLLSSNEAALDLVQDIAMSAFVHVREFHNAEHMQAWSMNRARWLAIDRLRVARRMWPIEDLSKVSGSVPMAPPEEMPGSFDALKEIFQEIGRLPQRQRAVILRRIEGYDVHDIARELNVAEATVRSLLRHARSTLSKALAFTDE